MADELAARREARRKQREEEEKKEKELLAQRQAEREKIRKQKEEQLKREEEERKKERDARRKQREEELKAEMEKAEEFTRQTLEELERKKKENDDKWKKEVEEKAVVEEVRREEDAKKAVQDLIQFKNKKDEERRHRHEVKDREERYKAASAVAVHGTTLPFAETHKPGWLGSAEVDIEVSPKVNKPASRQNTAELRRQKGGAPTGALGMHYTPVLSDEDEGGLRMAAFPARVPFKSFLKDYHFLKYDMKLSEEMLDAIYSIDDTLVDVETLQKEERMMKGLANELVEYLLANFKSFGVEESRIKVGESKVFMDRSLSLSLEQLREKKIAELVSHLQASIRTFLAKQKYNDLKRRK